MPNSSTTMVPDSANTSGTPWPLGYGNVWCTGKRLAYYMLENTGNHNLDFTRVGGWALGKGEWDGPNELWINDTLIWDVFSGLQFDGTQFHFHSGTDAIIGSGVYPSSTGPDQGVDSFWTNFPSAVTPTTFSGIANYFIFRKQESTSAIYSTSQPPSQSDGNAWTDVAPVGWWRARRTRIFDAYGNQIGYAWNTNPAWHFVDMVLERKVKPNSVITQNGPDALTAAEAACFNWSQIYESAQYYGTLIEQSDGSWRPRFEHHGVYATNTSLADMLSKVLQVSRSFLSNQNGQLGIICDKPRASVFDIGRNQVLPGSFSANDKSLTAGPNRLIGQFRGLLVPAFGVIASISCPDHTNPTVTFTEPHPCVPGDFIVIGGTDTPYDRFWTVNTVPGDSDSEDISTATSLTLDTQGSNFPAIYTGDGKGLAGLRQSRFKERYPDFNHKANQIARGAIAANVPRQRRRVSTTYDFGTSTYDQVSRICRYELAKTLGADTYQNGAFTSPYRTPPSASVGMELLATDDSGNGPAVGIDPGDHVTVLDTASFPYAGEYEVMEPMLIKPYTARLGGTTPELTATPSGGTVELQLGVYDEANFFDYTDLSAGGWQDVPNSDSSGSNGFTPVPLSDGGQLAFFSGGQPSGATLQLPSTGFTPTNLLAWCSPEGYIEENHDMHIISTCGADPNRLMTLNYTDGEGNIWLGDVAYMAACWIANTSVVTSTSLGFSWVQATLAGSGAEEILLGYGQIAGDGSAKVQLPAGWELAQAIVVAFPHDTEVATDNHCHIFSTSVDGDGTVHFNYQDGSGNTWYGNAAVLVFAWKNNGGTVATATTAGCTWVSIPVSTTTGQTFYVGTGRLSNPADSAYPTYAPANPTQVTLPSGVTGKSFQCVASPRSFLDDGNPSHGVRALYVDQNLNMNASMEDGEGHIKYGDGVFFAVMCE